MADYDSNWNNETARPAKLNVVSLFSVANEAALPSSGYEQHAKMMAEDTGTIYINDGNATTSSWTKKSGIIPSDIQVYPRSTVLGDYTLTPTSVVLSSNPNNGTVTFATANTNDAISLASGVYTRAGEKITVTTARKMLIVNFKANLKKVGAPTGTITARVRKVSDDSIVATATNTLAMSTLTTAYAEYTFTFANEVLPNEDVRLSLEAPTIDASNYVLLGGTNADSSSNGVDFGYNGTSYADGGDLNFTLTYRTDGNIIDGDTATSAQTNSEASPSCKLTLSTTADKEVAAITLWIPASLNTITSLKLSLSPDDTTYTLFRTILISELTTGAWNFIRLKRDVQQNRYLKIHSDNTGVLAITDVKVMAPTESQWNRRHGHKDITTSTSEAITA